jgi:hypothetical protein
LPTGLVDNTRDNADLYDLVAAFRQKAHLSADYTNELYEDLNFFVSRASAGRIARFTAMFKEKRKLHESYRNNNYVNAIVQILVLMCIIKVYRKP